MVTYAVGPSLDSFTGVPNTLMLLAVMGLFGALLVVAVLLGLNSRPGRHARTRPHRNAFGDRDQVTPRRKRAAIIVNPTKFEDLAAVVTTVGEVAATLGWDPPLVVETTQTDPGAGQARSALGEGVDLVCSLGGDGTVRMVASALAGTSTPLGLLPGGTGNLLARNLELPVTDIAEAFRVACTGRNRAVDVGYLTLQDASAPGGYPAPEGSTTPEGSAEHAFLVMAGIGLDATIMSETTEAAKARMGWPAYAATGLRNFLGPRLKAHISIDDGAPTPVQAHTVLIGNCGRITGGINLIPDARVDDGILDVVVIAPKGLAGWLNVSAQVLTQHRSARTQRLQRHTATRVTVTTEKPQAVQLDGDIVGESSALSARIEPKALLVRVATMGDPPPAG